MLAILSCVSGPGRPAQPGSGSPQAKSRPAVGVGRFLDTRQEHGSIFDIPSLPQESKVINGADLGPLVAGALVQELSNAGYRVIQFPADAPPDTVSYTVTGTIPELTRSDITIELEIRQGAGELLRRTYSVPIPGLDNPNVQLTRERLTAALTQTYQDLARRVMHDVTRAVR